MSNIKASVENTKLLSQTNSAMLKQVLRNKSDKTGWVESTPVTLSFNNGNRTFTITPTSASFEYWIQGQKFIKYAAETVVIDDTEGLWYIYYVLGTLTASQTPWDVSAGNKAFVAIIHWDATNNIELGILYELHGYLMHPSTHAWAHHTIGTRYQNGLAISLGAGGDLGKVGITAGEIHDEDIEVSITDGAGSSLFEQVLTLPAQIPVFYRSGSAAWRKYTAGDYPFYDNSGGDNIHYNLDNAGSWSSQAASGANKYIAMWIYGTNEQNEPIIAIMGQNESNTLAGARNDNVLDILSFGTLPFAEMKILFRLILRTDGGIIESLDLRATSNLPGGTFVPTSHGSLSGLGNDDHTIYLLADGTRAISGPITTDTLNIATTKLLAFVDGGSADIIRDEDNMVSDDPNALATQQSIKAFIEALLGIGIANKRWGPLLYADSSGSANNRHDSFAYTNLGATDYVLFFEVPLPYTLGAGHNLVITDTRIGIYDSDANDYVDRMYMFAWSAFGTRGIIVDINHDAVYGTGAGEFTYGHTNQTIGGTYHRVGVAIDVNASTAGEIDIGYLEIEYYYT